MGLGCLLCGERTLKSLIKVLVILNIVALWHFVCASCYFHACCTESSMNYWGDHCLLLKEIIPMCLAVGSVLKILLDWCFFIRVCRVVLSNCKIVISFDGWNLNGLLHISFYFFGNPLGNQTWDLFKRWEERYD